MAAAAARGKRNVKSYNKRKKTVKRKARQLATLCDVPVCVVCINPDGTIETVPKEKEKVIDILLAYKGSKKVNLTPNNDKKKSKIVFNEKLETWDPSFDFLPEKDLMNLVKDLDRKSKIVNEAIRKKESQKKDLDRKSKIVNEAIRKKESQKEGKRSLVDNGTTSSRVGRKKAKGSANSSLDSGIDFPRAASSSICEFSGGILESSICYAGMTKKWEKIGGGVIDDLPTSACRPPPLFEFL